MILPTRQQGLEQVFKNNLRKVFLLVWILAFQSLASAGCGDNQCLPKGDQIPMAWLDSRPLTIQEIADSESQICMEVQNVVDSISAADDSVPIDSDRCRSTADDIEGGFPIELKSGDLIFRFSNPNRCWEKLSGRAGYAIVREGEVVGSLVTVLN